MITIKKTIEMPDEKVVKTIKSFAKQHGFNVYEEREYYILLVPIKQVSNMPLICSHIDTVRHSTQLSIVESAGKITNKNGVLGGDDRCGVWIALNMIEDEIPAYYAFFHKEECGGGGSDSFMERYEDVILKSSCYIGLDRRGSKDIAIYSYECKSLIDIFSKHGYEVQHGSFTDVSNIESVYPKGTVNLSVGFYKEHTKEEYVLVKDTINTLKALYLVIPELYKPFTDLKICASKIESYSYYDRSWNYPSYKDSMENDPFDKSYKSFLNYPTLDMAEFSGCEMCPCANVMFNKVECESIDYYECLEMYKIALKNGEIK